MAYAAWSVTFGEQPSAAKWNILGTNDAFFESIISTNGSNQTIIGSNNVRATRYVPITPVAVVSAVNPGDTNWTAVDVTANTSARAFAICGISSINDTAGASRQLHMRQTGSGLAQDSTTLVNATGGTTNPIWNGFGTIGVDTSQSFDWSVTNADVDAINIVVHGYHEYVD